MIDLERRGIPTVLIDFEDQDEFVREEARVLGMPELRFVHASRTMRGPQDIEHFLPKIFDALTQPLTKEEKAEGMWTPNEPRILFEGTLEAAEEFYMQSEPNKSMMGAPYAKYTDGLPIVIPTEERVEKMLRGTSHTANEIINYQADLFLPDAPEAIGSEPSARKGEPVRYMPTRRVATVEQVAINAVMAGCKPEYFPVVLAIAEASAGTGDGRAGQGFIVSGPVAEEIGMNYGFGVFGMGNPANRSIARSSVLMWRNLGGAIPGVTVTSNFGDNPAVASGFCIAENAKGLPKEWMGLNEELGYKKDQSIVMATAPGSFFIHNHFMPGVYRALQKDGHGAIARFLDVKGVPGPHNWLEYVIQGVWATREGGFTLALVPERAQHLVDIGFKSKDDVYKWIWERSFEPVGRYRMRGGPDFVTNGWTSIERTSGKVWKELPEDYMVPAGGQNPRA
ncbi:MAG: hypothetical protein GX631_01940, partial [Dehalococcoidales bacterium]|nr:hypothetical protein [Dehalococcoidales bacterium]